MAIFNTNEFLRKTFSKTIFGTAALLNDCVPKNLLRAYPQQWLPGESNS